MLILFFNLLEQGYFAPRLKSSLQSFSGRHSQPFPFYVLSSPLSWLITGFVTKLTRQVSLVEQELPTLPEHMSSPPIFSGICVTRSLVLYVCFVDRCLPFYTFSLGHSVVCSSSINGFWFAIFTLFSLSLTFAGFVYVSKAVGVFNIRNRNYFTLRQHLG